MYQPIANFAAQASQQFRNFIAEQPATPSPVHTVAKELPKELQVKAILQEVTQSPPELVDAIMDFAEMWLHSSVSIDHRVRVPDRGRYSENAFLLRSLPIGFPEAPGGDLEAYKSMAIKPRHLASEYSKEQLNQFAGDQGSALEHPCRKIVFTIVSHDQGWGGKVAHRGTYHGSWTWFDVGLERFDTENTHEASCPHCRGEPVSASPKVQASDLPPCALRPIVPTIEAAHRDPDDPDNPDVGFIYHHDLLPSNMRIQCNKTAVWESETYTIEWRATDNIDPTSPEAIALEEAGRGPVTGNGEFVRSLRLGDVVTIWAKARFAGWINHVESLKLDVYWAA